MVWYNGGSALEKAIERHNNGGDVHNKECGCKAPDADVCSCAKSEQCDAPKHCSCAQERQGDLLSALTKDRDLLLIAAVMLILMHEKADKKLILALAFVLFA